MSEQGAEQRRPTLADIPAVLELIAEGMSLRAACRELGLHTPSTHTFIQADDGLSEQYGRAREQRAEVYQEQALALGLAAATGRTLEIGGESSTIDPSGARVALEAIKWATARMAPKTAPVERHHHTFGELSDVELDARINQLSGGGGEPASDP